MGIQGVGKRATFRKNIRAITGARTLTSALKEWTVARLIDLPPTKPMASCELCGTHFRNGALMRHARQKATVTIGGTCVQIIRRAEFGALAKYRYRRQATWQVFQEHYKDSLTRITRGSWLTWMINNAPPRFGSLVVDLRQLGAVRSDADMQRLIRFHDTHRKYPAAALVDDLHAFARACMMPVPDYLTLEQARRLMKRANKGYSSEMIWERSEEYYRCKFRPFLRRSPQRGRAWGALDGQAQRAALALAALSDQGAELAFPSSLAEDFKAVTVLSSEPQFVWNKSIGLGFVSSPSHMGNGKARVWVWGQHRKVRPLYDLRFFRSVRPLDDLAVRQLEELAFKVERVTVSPAA